MTPPTSHEGTPSTAERTFAAPTQRDEREQLRRSAGGHAIARTGVTLDATDRALLRALQADGRSSYADLASLVGLSAPAVRQRVARLTDAGVLQVVAVTDPLALGWRSMAVVGLRVDGDVTAVADAVGSLPECVHLVRTLGGYDLVGEVVGRGEAEVARTLDTIRGIAGVRSADAYPSVEIHTHRFTWEPEEPDDHR